MVQLLDKVPSYTQLPNTQYIYSRLHILNIHGIVSISEHSDKVDSERTL